MMQQVMCQLQILTQTNEAASMMSTSVSSLDHCAEPRMKGGEMSGMSEDNDAKLDHDML